MPGSPGNAAPLSWPLPRGDGEDLFPIYLHVMVSRVGGGWASQIRRGRRNRERCIRDHGRGECRGAACGEIGCIDALGDARNASTFMGRRVASTGVGSVSSPGSASASVASSCRASPSAPDGSTLLFSSASTDGISIFDGCGSGAVVPSSSAKALSSTAPVSKCPQFGEGLGIGQAGPVELLRGPVDLEVLLADVDGAESIVVDPHGRTVRGLGRPDVERVVMVAGGEYAACQLEQQQIEGRLEVAGELALDDGRADGPQIVGEADADARFLARLGFRIAGRSEGSHECGRIDVGK